MARRTARDDGDGTAGEEPSMEKPIEEKQLMVGMGSMVISAASLAVGIAALCLNEKGVDEMAEATPGMELKIARQEQRDAAKKRRAAKATARAEKTKKQTQIRQYAGSIGYNGPIILLNDKPYGIVPLDGASPKAEARKTPPRKPSPARSTGCSWVAMEMNVRTGGDRQAIVCRSRDEARRTALEMKSAHREGSRQSAECRQGYACVDTSGPIDVRGLVTGRSGEFHRV